MEAKRIQNNNNKMANSSGIQDLYEIIIYNRFGDEMHSYTISNYEKAIGSLKDDLKLAEVGPRGGIKASPKAPKSDTPNPNPKGEGTAKGDASGKRGAEVSAKDEETLKNKAAEFK